MSSTPTCRVVSYKQKLAISALAAGVFAVVGSPMLYSATGKILKGSSSPTGRPRGTGLLLHSVVFFAVVYAMMAPWKKAVKVCEEPATASTSSY